MNRAYEFYRVLMFTGIGIVLIWLSTPLYNAIGAGFMCMGIILHMTTISKWQTEDLLKEVKKE